MSRNGGPDPKIIGFKRRIRHLLAWCARIEKKLGDQSHKIYRPRSRFDILWIPYYLSSRKRRRDKTIRLKWLLGKKELSFCDAIDYCRAPNTGAIWFHQYALHLLETKKRGLITTYKQLLDETEIRSPPKMISWIGTCRDAEQTFIEIESYLHPMLASRSKSDADYDGILSKMINNIASSAHIDGYYPCQIYPMAVHKLGRDKAASVYQISLKDYEKKIARLDRRKGDGRIEHVVAAAFITFPSIRSLTVLTLHYHEIGHVFWNHYLHDRDISLLKKEMRKTFPKAFDRIRAEYAEADRGSQEITDEPENEGRKISENKKVRDKEDELFGEIAADCFAGMVAGYTYYSTLAGYIFIKTPYWERHNLEYLPLIDRMAVVEGCCHEVTPNCCLSSDGFIDAYRSLRQLLTNIKKPKIVVSEFESDERLGDIRNLVLVFKRVLGERLNLRLASEYPEINSYDELKKVPADIADVLRVLHHAAQYRNRLGFSEDRIGEYVQWETRVTKQLKRRFRSTFPDRV